LLGVIASAYAEPVLVQFPPGYGSGSYAFAAWTDIAFVDGPDRPNVLDLTFAVEGRLSWLPNLYPNFPPGNSGATIGVGLSGRVADFTTVSAYSANSPLSLFAVAPRRSDDTPPPRLDPRGKKGHSVSTVVRA
jgi:hypothetical protein